MRMRLFGGGSCRLQEAFVEATHSAHHSPSSSLSIVSYLKEREDGGGGAKSEEAVNRIILCVFYGGNLLLPLIK